MARIPLVDPETATGAVAATFAQITATSGRVFNGWRALANSPRMLQAVWDRRQSVLDTDVLPRLTKEAIALAVSEVNANAYCLRNHSAALAGLGASPERIDEFRAGRGRDEAEQALLDFAVAAGTDPHSITDATFDRLRALGHSDAEIFEAAGVAIHFTAMNRFLDTFAVDLD